jgi:antitoxin component YwqK of YwqJK toxin-antitoxin module
MSITKVVMGLTILFISLLSSPSWSQTMDDLVRREGIFYQKFTNIPFTGKVTGKDQGSFKNGKREGYWISYHENGQLWYEGKYKSGKQEGASVGYHDNGELFYKGNYKNFKQEGAWVIYHENGQLESKGTWKNDKKEGAWVGYNKDGTVDKGNTGTFKDGVKISD